MCGVSTGMEQFGTNKAPLVHGKKIGTDLMVQVSVSGDGQHVWGVNRYGQVYYRNGLSGLWQPIAEKMSHISVSHDGQHVWGVNEIGELYHRQGLGGSWQQSGTERWMQVSCSGDGQHLWGISYSVIQ